MTTIKPHISSC